MWPCGLLLTDIAVKSRTLAIWVRFISTRDSAHDFTVKFSPSVHVAVSSFLDRRNGCTKFCLPCWWNSRQWPILVTVLSWHTSHVTALVMSRFSPQSNVFTSLREALFKGLVMSRLHMTKWNYRYPSGPYTYIYYYLPESWHTHASLISIYNRYFWSYRSLSKLTWVSRTWVWWLVTGFPCSWSSWKGS